MALTDKKIRRLIELELNMVGSTRESRAIIDGIVKSIGNANRAAAQWRTDIRAAGAAVAQTNNTLISLARDSEKTSKGIKGISENFSALHGHLRSTIPLLGLIGTEIIGFEKSLQFFDKFNRSLLTTAGQFSKYAIGITAVENKLDSLAKQTSLTRTESMKLLSSYEHGFNFVSLQRGELLMMNLKKAVGANAEAMLDMQNFLSGIIAKFPELEDEITRMDGLDRKRLQTQARMLFLSGQISFADSKRLQDYVNQNAQLSAADKKRQQDAEDQIEAMNRIETAVEKIALILGKTLTPAMELLSGWIDKGADGLAKWVPAIAAIAATIPALDGLKLLGGSFNRVSGGVLSRGFSAVAGNSYGRAALSATAAIGTGAAYKYAYETETGQDYYKHAGNLARMGRVASMATAGGAMGAAGGPAGIAVGAGIGATIGAGQESWATYSDISEQKKQIADEEKADMEALVGITNKWSDAIKNAQTDIEKAYDTSEKKLNEQRVAMNKFWEDSQRGVLNTMLHFGNSHSGSDEAKYADMQKAYQKILTDEVRTSPQDKINEDTNNARNAAIQREKDRIASTGAASGASAAFLNTLADHMNGGMLAMSPKEFADLFSGALASIQNRVENVEVGNNLGADENKKLGLSNTSTFKYGSGDYDKISSRYTDLDKQKQAGKLSDADVKEYESLGKIMDSFSSSVGPLQGELQDVNASMNLLMITSDKAMEAYSSQRAELSANAQKMYLSGQVDMSALMTQAKAANDLYKIAIQDKQVQLDATVTQMELDQKQAKEAVALRKQQAEQNPQDKTKADEYARARVEEQQAAGRLGAAKSAAEMNAKILQQSQNELEVMNEVLKANEMIIEAKKNTMSLEQNQLQLSTQYGNSSQNSVKIANQILDANRDIIGSYEQQLKLLDQQVAANPQMAEQDRVAIQQKQVEYEKEITAAKTQQLEILKQIGEFNKVNVDYAAAVADQYSAMVDLADSMGMGVSASANARMKAAQAIGEEIKQVKVDANNLTAALAEGVDKRAADMMAQDKSLKIEDARKIAGDQLLQIQTQLAQKQTHILGLMQKQAQITKAIRDGYLSSIQAMTTGTGIFAKFMFTQEKGLGVLLTNIKGVPQAMGTGGVSANRSVGQRSFAQFGIGGGIFGQYDNAARPDYYSGGPEIASEIKDMQGQMAQFQRSLDRTTSTGAVGYEGASGTGASGAFLKDMTKETGVKMFGDAMMEANQPEVGLLQDILQAIKDLRNPNAPKPPGAAGGLAPSRMTPGSYPPSGDMYPVLVNSNEMILNPKQHHTIASALGTTSEGLLSYRGMPKAADGMAPMSFEQWNSPEARAARDADAKAQNAAIHAASVTGNSDDTIVQWKAANKDTVNYRTNLGNLPPLSKREVTAQELGITQQEKDDNDFLNRGVRDTFMAAKKNGASSKDANAAAHQWLEDQKQAKIELQKESDLSNAITMHNQDAANAVYKPLDPVYKTGDWTPEQLLARQKVNWEMDEAKKTGETKDLEMAKAALVQVDAQAQEARANRAKLEALAKLKTEQDKSADFMAGLRAAHRWDDIKHTVGFDLQNPDNLATDLISMVSSGKQKDELTDAYYALRVNIGMAGDRAKDNFDKAVKKRTADTNLVKQATAVPPKELGNFLVNSLTGDINNTLNSKYSGSDVRGVNKYVPHVKLYDLDKDKDGHVAGAGADAYTAANYNDIANNDYSFFGLGHTHNVYDKITNKLQHRAWNDFGKPADAADDPNDYIRNETVNEKYGAYQTSEYVTVPKSLLPFASDTLAAQKAAGDKAQQWLLGGPVTADRIREAKEMARTYIDPVSKHAAFSILPTADPNMVQVQRGVILEDKIVMDKKLSKAEATKGTTLEDEYRGLGDTGNNGGLRTDAPTGSVTGLLHRINDPLLTGTPQQRQAALAQRNLNRNIINQVSGNFGYFSDEDRDNANFTTNAMITSGAEQGLTLGAINLTRYGETNAYMNQHSDEYGKQSSFLANSIGSTVTGSLLGGQLIQGAGAFDAWTGAGSTRVLSQAEGEWALAMEGRLPGADRALSGFGSDIPAGVVPKVEKLPFPLKTTDLQVGSYADALQEAGGSGGTGRVGPWSDYAPVGRQSYSLDPDMFNLSANPSIPKYHTGGVVPGITGEEVPAMLQAGEKVLTKPQAAMYNRPMNMTDDLPSAQDSGGGGSASSPVNITINVDTSQLATIPSKVQAAIDGLKRGLAGDGQLNSGKSFNRYGK